MDDLIEPLGALLLILHDANTTLKLRKWFYFQLYVEYLDQIISYRELTVSETHIHAFRHFELPRLLRKLPSLLGACNVYEIFTKTFATIGRPPNRLTQKDARRRQKRLGQLDKEICEGARTAQKWGATMLRPYMDGTIFIVLTD